MCIRYPSLACRDANSPNKIPRLSDACSCTPVHERGGLGMPATDESQSTTRPEISRGEPGWSRGAPFPDPAHRPDHESKNNEHGAKHAQNQPPDVPTADIAAL